MTLPYPLNLASSSQEYRIRKDLKGYLNERKVTRDTQHRIMIDIGRLQDTLDKDEASEIIGLYVADKKKQATQKLFKAVKLTK